MRALSNACPSPGSVGWSDSASAGSGNAFYGVRGMSPKRCMLAERLEGARRALADARARPGTVTGVATRYGFYELGRFAGTYKDAFGETPSETLYGASRKSDAEHVSR